MMRGLNVVLVHGTWGRGFFGRKPRALWCRPDSQFVRLLTSECERSGLHASISAFNWSGNNSIFERAAASIELRRILETQTPLDVPLLVVAHSHGGNVALRAITGLSSTSHVHLCTLATPFFRLFETKRVLQEALSNLILIPAMLVLYFRISSPFASLLKTFLSPIIAFGFALTITLVCSTVFGFLLNRLLINPAPGKGEPSAWQQRPRLLCEATYYDAALLSDRLLVLRGLDDEAGLSLASGAAANRVLRLIYYFAGRIIPTLIITGLLSAFVSDHPDWVEVWLFTVICGCIALLSALLLPSVVRSIFGRELAFGAVRCDAAYDSVPDSTRCKVQTLQSNPSTTGLLHSLHENPVAPACIVEWVAEKLLLPPSTSTHTN